MEAQAMGVEGLGRWMTRVWIVLMLTGPAYGQAVEWIRTAGPEGGGVHLLLRTPEHGLLAAAGNTLLRSQDRGATWQIGLADVVVSDLSAWPDGSLLAGTLFDGLFRSLDDGRTWVRADLGPPRALTRQLVYSPTEGIFARTDQGALQSGDGGITWRGANEGIGGENAAYRLAVLAVGPDGGVYAGTSAECCLGFDSAIHRWDADSTHWDVLTGAGGVLHRIVFGPDGSVYAGSSSIGEFGDGGLFRSVAGGPWERVSGFGDVLALHVQPDGTLYAGTPHGVRVSTDRGTTWTDLGLDFLAVGALVFDGPDLLAGTRQHCFPAIDYPYCQAGFGVFRRPEGVDAWTRVPLAAPSAEVRGLALAPDGGLLALATNGLWRTGDRGASWQKVDQSGEVYPFPYEFHYATSLWGTSWGDVLLGTGFGSERRFSAHSRSSDDGTEWFALGWPGASLRDLVGFADSMLVGVTRRGVTRSADRGETWVPGGVEEALTAIAAGPGATLFAGSEQGGRVYLSDDAGQTWTASEVGAEGQITALAAAPGGRLYAAARPFLYTTDDQGATWMRAGPDSVLAQEIEVNADGDVFVREYGRLRRSRDGGASWEAISEGLPREHFSALALDEAGFLYVATEGQSVFRSLKATVVATERGADVPPRFVLLPNYPNPFNPTTTIPFTLNQPVDVRLDVVDVLGRVVTTLATGALPAGTHAASWEAGALPGGLYFVRLRAGDRVQTRPAVLLR